MNNKAFSIINILIIIGIIFLSYLIYDDFFKEKKLADNQEVSDDNIIIENSDNNEENSSNDVIKDDIDQPSNLTTPTTPTNNNSNSKVEVKEEEDEKVEETSNETKEENNTVTPGYYKNISYRYEIRYPVDWPLRVRSAENVSVGTVPPKNGQGAITIEIGEGGEAEVNQLKKEASKYPGLLKIEESIVTISNVSGDKLVLTNSIANKKDVYIFLDKNNVSYLIKYSYESDSFINKVEEALKTFKFL